MATQAWPWHPAQRLLDHPGIPRNNAMVWARIIQFFVLRYRWVLVCATILTLLATVALTARGLRADYRLEAFVATSDDSYLRFRSFMEEFTSNEFALVAVRGADPFSPATEAVVRELADDLLALPSVQRCSSLADIPAWLRGVLGDRLLTHPLIAGNLLSHDRRTAALLCQMSGEATGGGGSGEQRRETVAAMRVIVAKARADHPEFEIILTGPYVTLIDMYAYVDRDLLVFSVAAFVLTVLAMWFVFRRWQPMLFAGAVGACAVLCTLGLTVALGIVTSLITQMIVILLIVLAVANCVHLSVAAEETVRALPLADVRGRAKATLGRMAAPCTAVMLTTAVGFGSVCISEVAPVRRFGALMVFGLLIALVVSLAGVVALHGQSDPHERRFSQLSSVLSRLADVAVRRRRACIIVFAIVVAAIVAGAGRLKFESDFVKNFRPDSKVRRSYRFIEEHLSPLGSMELVVRRRDGKSVVSAETVRTAHALGADVVDAFPMVRTALSLADMLTLLSSELPANDAELAIRMAPLEAWPGGARMLRNFVNEKRDALRINLRCIEGFDVGEKLAAAERIRTLAAKRFGPAYEVEVTGLYHFYAKLVAGLLRDQYRALGLTVVAMFVAMWFMLRSMRLTIIAMIVNLIPVAACLGAMGWARIPINMTTAMMLSVTLGIAVDDTLHYLWRLRDERAAAPDLPAALRRTHAGVGRACVFTTVVITGGFSILVVSQFLPTAYFGGLVGFTMLVALAADLLLLPALVVAFKAFGKGLDVS